MPSRPLSPSTSPAAARRHKSILIAAGATSAAVFLLLAGAAALLFCIYRAIRRRRRRSAIAVAAANSPDIRLRPFSYRDLRAATAGFSASRRLGRGASGSVFLGALLDGKLVAVKLLDPAPPSTSGAGDLEFRNELQTLIGIPPSPFVVPLVGYCLEGGRCRRGLVFDYMPNGSLQDALFVSGQPICWIRRYGIILDIAQALSFLHSVCDPAVIHCDIKPSNILLDSDFRAKVSDFGLARFKHAGDPEVDSFSQESGKPVADFAAHPPSPASPSIDHNVGSGRPIAGKTSGAEAGGGNAAAPGRRRDWWLKEVVTGELSSGNPELEDDIASSQAVNSCATGSEIALIREEDGLAGGNPKKKKNKKRAREWWKDEYFAETNKKNSSSSSSRAAEVKKKKNSGGRFGRRDSSSSMRGTVCYVAPELGGGGRAAEKAGDMYSFGVLILVVVSGRRPLQVLPSSSTMKLERANLVSWCRQLARGGGDVLDLVDERMKEEEGFSREQVTLCIELALRCLQRLPELRPDAGDVVKILRGEMELPGAAAFDLSPLSKSRVLSSSRRRRASTSPEK